MRRTPVKRSHRTIAAGIAALGLLAAACGDAGTDPDPQGSTPDPTASEADPAAYCEGGVERDLIWAHEQEPPDMHLDDPNNNLSITSWITQALLEGLYGNTADVEHFPELLAEEAQATDNDDGSWTVSFRLRDGLVWSDGEPLTARDVQFTHDVIMEGVDPATGEGGVYLIGDRTGYDLVTEFEVTSDTEFAVTFSEPFAGFRDLYHRVFPAHVLGDGGAAAANEALPDFQLADGTPIPSSGPMLFDEWEKGVSMHLVRNDSYHGSVSPDVTNDGTACVTGIRTSTGWPTPTRRSTH
jgi:peptide/nickel transport system substrate-binding protein